MSVVVVVDDDDDDDDDDDTFSNRTHFRACGRFRLSSVQRARRVAEKRRRKKKNRGRTWVRRQVCRTA